MTLFSPRIRQAIDFAIQIHWKNEHQYRKGKDVPYITHPMTVALILNRASKNEDLVIAGLLHDTIEDSHKPDHVTRNELAERFGKQVAELVDSVTEQDKKASWEVRKRNALAHIEEMDHDALMLKSADLISNLTEIRSDWDSRGDQTFRAFERDKQTTLENYRRVIKAIQKKCESNPLYDDLSAILDDIDEMLATNE